MLFHEHEQYTRAKPYLKAVRDCIEGEPAIKRGRMVYLKHPNAIDQTSTQQRARYEAYLDSAEFKPFASETEKSMIGRMLDGEPSIEIPEGIAHLEQNSDGDGMPLIGAVEVIYKNLLEAKFYILLAEFNGLADVDTEQLSIADLRAINPLASIKHYTRESLIDWDFRRINGVMQLSLMVLVERSEVRDLTTLAKEDVKSYLILGLDENGDYYQRKHVDGKEITQGETFYPLVNGQRLKWIPAEIVVDEETPSGCIPEGLGYLAPLCFLSLYRYRVSADYKEALRLIQPTLFTQGWKGDDWALFQTLNDRDYLAFGAGVSNNLPDGVTVDIQGLGVSTDPFMTYFELNDRELNALGASIDSAEGQGTMTATQAAMVNAKATAVMKGIVNNTQAALARVMSYCAMYQGLWGADQVEANLEQIKVVLPKDFGLRITAEEVAAVVQSVQASLMSKAEGTRKLVAGGFTISDADEIMKELDEQGPDITAMTGFGQPLPGQPSLPEQEEDEQP